MVYARPARGRVCHPSSGRSVDLGTTARVVGGRIDRVDRPNRFIAPAGPTPIPDRVQKTCNQRPYFSPIRRGSSPFNCGTAQLGRITWH